MIVPQQGSAQFEEFVEKARKNPASMEAKALDQMYVEAVDQTQKQLRGMLQQMIELVPGQLFRDVTLFHEKFGLSPTEDHGHRLPADLIQFRIKFMLEELREYCDAVETRLPFEEFEQIENRMTFDAEKAFDALIDLVYVALGTAFLHRFPFNDGWRRVQAANMSKVRAESADDPRSTRKHSADIVKPAGWQPPCHVDLLDEACPVCNGKGTLEKIVPAISSMVPDGIEEVNCAHCVKGRRKRATPIQGNGQESSSEAPAAKE